MTLTKQTNDLTEYFKAIPVSQYEDIRQGGLYLMLDSLTSVNHHLDKVYYELIFSSRTLNKDENSVTQIIDELRNKLMQLDNKKLLIGIDKGYINNTLYAYRIKFAMEIFSLAEDDEDKVDDTK